MVVVKIGGSLQSTQYIKKWIHEIKLNRNTSFLLVFGGGRYAEKIRKDQMDLLKKIKVLEKQMSDMRNVQLMMIINFR